MPKFDIKSLERKYRTLQTRGGLVFDENKQLEIDDKIDRNGIFYRTNLAGVTPLTNLHNYLTQKRSVDATRKDYVNAGAHWAEFRKSVLESKSLPPLPDVLQSEILAELKEYKAEKFWEIRHGILIRPDKKLSGLKAQAIRTAKSGQSLNEEKFTFADKVNLTILRKTYRRASQTGNIAFLEGIPQIQESDYAFDKELYNTYIAGHTPLTALYFRFKASFDRSCALPRQDFKKMSSTWKKHFSECVSLKKWLPLPDNIREEIDAEIHPVRHYWTLTEEGLSRNMPHTKRSNEKASLAPANCVTKKARIEPIAVSHSSLSASEYKPAAPHAVPILPEPPVSRADVVSIADTLPVAPFSVHSFSFTTAFNFFPALAPLRSDALVDAVISSPATLSQSVVDAEPLFPDAAPFFAVPALDSLPDADPIVDAAPLASGFRL